MRFKALDTETGKVVYFDCAPCENCGKWNTINPEYKYCPYCGAKKIPAPADTGTGEK